MKKQLAELKNSLRANAQLRDEQRDQAIRTSLQLGAFLCTKLKDDGEFYDRLIALHEKTALQALKMPHVNDVKSKLTNIKKRSTLL